MVRVVRSIMAMVALLLAVQSSAGSRLAPDEAADLLSRYPAGGVPVDPVTITAIQVIGERGTRDEISLLRNLAEHERDEVRSVAVTSISRIRERQRDAQRKSFARTLPDWPDLADRIEVLRSQGLGADEAECTAYAQRILGPGAWTVASRPAPSKGDAEVLLAEGRPALALAVLASDPSPSARRLEATAWEDMGEPQQAIRRYVLLAARGDVEASGALDRYGIDSERLLLGLIARPDPYLSPADQSQLVEVLVRQGDRLTVEVFAEQSRHPSATERAIATDALARMVQRGTLTPIALKLARAALTAATGDSVESIRAIALEAL